MKQGLLKTTSLTALVVAGGMMANSAGAFAADLGGNCCADLEERVADLEATVARKGTRKTSLEIWGQVNKAVVAWDDGVDHGIFLGEDNTNSSTRFGFRGNATVLPGIKAGYSIMIEWATGARTYGISQYTPINRASAGTFPGTGTYGGFSADASFIGSADAIVQMRDANWWIESDRLGRLTLGRYDSHNSSLQFNIDLAGIATTVGGATQSFASASALAFRTNNATGSTAVTGTGATIGGPAGGANSLPNQPLVQSLGGYQNWTNYNLLNTTDNAEGSPRVNGVYYNTPTFHGFSIAGGIGGVANSSNPSSNPGCFGGQAPCTDDFNYGLFYSAVLKYAAEFNGLRVAAALGYEDAKEVTTNGMVAGNGTAIRPDAKDTGISLSLLHVPTGLFAQGYYNTYTRGHDVFASSTTGALSAYQLNGKPTDTARELLVQVGIAKNWFGIGNTVPFVQYGRTTNGFNTFGLETAAGAFLNGVSGASTGNLGANGNTASGQVAYFGDVTTNTMWGVGIVQNLDAAAMSLYAGYNDYGLTSSNCSAAGGCKDISSFITGALIKF